MGAQTSLAYFYKKHHRKFQAGHIYIEMPENSLILAAGQVVQGVVHATVQQQFPTSGLYLYITGKENTYMYKKHSSDRWVETETERYLETTTWYEDHYGKKRFFSRRLKLMDFVDSVINPGQYSFHFKF